MNKDIDIIIYGATGFTGKLCVKYFQSLKTSVTWAIAGRNITKLQKVAKHNQTEVEILIADSDDESALDQLTSRARVVLSTTGPFHRYGSKLVASCIKNHAHYVDITGENFWVKGLIEKHHAEASAKGIRIIPSCGFDSIPSDLGAFFQLKLLVSQLKESNHFIHMRAAHLEEPLRPCFLWQIWISEMILQTLFYLIQKTPILSSKGNLVLTE